MVRVSEEDDERKGEILNIKSSLSDWRARGSEGPCSYVSEVYGPPLHGLVTLQGCGTRIGYIANHSYLIVSYLL